MSKLAMTTGAQWPLVAEFEFNWNDTMVDIAGVEKSFGAVGTNVFDVMTPPPGSIVIGGTIAMVTAFVGPTAASLDVGDSDDTNRYSSVVVNLLLTAAHVPFTLAGAVPKVYSGSQKVRLTITNTVAAATAGKARVVVFFSVSGRQNENLRTV